MSSPTSDADAPVSRPTRRSAAVASKNAWQALLPHKKGALSGDEDDGGDFYTPERPTPKERGRKRGTPAQSTGPKKRMRTPKVPKTELPEAANDDDERNSVDTTPTVSSRKVLAPQQQRKPLAEGSTESCKSASATAISAVQIKANTSPTRQSQKASSTKPSSAQKVVKEAASSSQPNATATATVTAASQPLVIRPKASILGKRASILSPKPPAENDSAGSQGNSADKSPSQRAHQQMLLKSGAGAMTKEELEEIDREVLKHGLDDMSNGDAGRTGDGSHDSEEADEYPACPPKPRPSLTARGGRGNAVNSVSRTSTRGGGTAGTRGRGSRGARGAGGASRRGRGGGMASGGGEIGEYKAAGSVVGPAIMRNPGRPQMPGSGGTVKVLRLRPNSAMPPNGGGGNGGAPRSGGYPFMMPATSSAMGPPMPQRSAAFGSMYASLSREVNDVSQRYADRVVPGTTVQEFSGIVDDVTQELNRVIDEKMRMRAYMDEMIATRVVELEMKDKKIQELEYTVETLQSKLLVALKRIQLNALKNEAGSAKKSDIDGGAKSTTKSAEVSKDSKSEKPAEDAESDSAADGRPSGDSDGPKSSQPQRIVPRAYAPSQLPKFATRPQISQQESRINAFRYYEDDNDAEDMDEEDGRENSKARSVGMAVSGPGGGSIFKPVGRDAMRPPMPMSLNAMNGRRVLMRGFSGAPGGRPYLPPNAPRRFNDSEDGLIDEEEEEEMDEMEDEDDGVTLTNEERRNLANLASRNGGILMKAANQEGTPMSGEDEESMVIGAEELVDGGEVGANQTVL